MYTSMYKWVSEHKEYMLSFLPFFVPFIMVGLSQVLNKVGAKEDLGDYIGINKPKYIVYTNRNKNPLLISENMGIKKKVSVGHYSLYEQSIIEILINNCL